MDPKAELQAALQRLRKAAASQLARRDQLTAEVERLHTLHAADPSDGALTARLETARAALDAAIADFEQSKTMLQDAPRLEAELDRAVLLRQVQELSARDPFERSAEAIALDNVREAGAAMDAELRLVQELEPQKPPPPTREEREARARAELDRLKAERKDKKRTL